METPPIIELVETYAQRPGTIEDATKQYDASQHKVHDPAIRKKKAVQKDTGRTNEETGEPIMATSYEEVNRLSFPFQKLIVNRRTAFMNVGKMEVYCQPYNDVEQRLLDMVVKCRKDNKLQYKTKEIAKRMMSELQCAELWYSEALDAGDGYWGGLSKGKFRMRMRILSPTLGDELYPVFSNLGDLIYFGRKYKTRPEAGVNQVMLGKTDEIQRFDIYSKERIERYVEIDGGWKLESSIEHSYGKIPIIYYSQEEPEWIDVQPAIERLEELLSNFADSNDYNGSPILVAKGTIKGFSAKGERGKVLELEGEGADIKYVNWDQAPESIKLEIETLNEFIYAHTQTADFAMERMKGLGGLSGVAFDRVFIDPQLAAQDKLDGGFGECLQRQLNFLKSACASIDTSLKSAVGLEMEPDVPPFRVNDLREQVETMIVASGGKPVISQETGSNAVASALGIDPKEEWERIKEEEDTLGDVMDLNE